MAHNSTILAIISTIIGGLILFVGTTLYADYFKQPNIDINLDPVTGNEYYNKGQIRIDNMGMTSAEDLRITLNSDNAILSVPSVSSIDSEVTNATQQGESLIIETSRLVPDGSIFAEIGLNIIDPKKRSNLNVTAAYNDRSSSANFGIQRLEIVDTDKVVPPVPFLQKTLIIIAGLGVLGVIGFYAYRKYFRFRSNRIRKKICEDACLVVKVLKNKDDGLGNLTDRTTLATKLYSYNLWNNESMENKYKLVGDKIYGEVEEFFQKVTIRDNLIKDGKFYTFSNKEKALLNNELMELAKRVFSDICFDPERSKHKLVNGYRVVQGENREGDIRTDLVVQEVKYATDGTSNHLVVIANNSLRLSIPFERIECIDYKKNVYIKKEYLKEYHKST